MSGCDEIVGVVVDVEAAYLAMCRDMIVNLEKLILKTGRGVNALKVLFECICEKPAVLVGMSDLCLKVLPKSVGPGFTEEDFKRLRMVGCHAWDRFGPFELDEVDSRVALEVQNVLRRWSDERGPYIVPELCGQTRFASDVLERKDIQSFQAMMFHVVLHFLNCDKYSKTQVLQAHWIITLNMRKLVNLILDVDAGYLSVQDAVKEFCRNDKILEWYVTEGAFGDMVGAICNDYIIRAYNIWSDSSQCEFESMLAGYYPSLYVFFQEAASAMAIPTKMLLIGEEISEHNVKVLKVLWERVYLYGAVEPVTWFTAVFTMMALSGRKLQLRMWVTDMSGAYKLFNAVLNYGIGSGSIWGTLAKWYVGRKFQSYHGVQDLKNRWMRVLCV